MKLNKLQIFLISVGSAIVLTLFLAPFYENVFTIYGGSWIIPIEFETYPVTFFLVYIFTFILLYKGFSRKVDFWTTLYFLIVPFFFFSVSGGPELVGGGIMLASGLILGWLIRNKINRAQNKE